MPTLKIDVDGLRQADAGLRRFGAGVLDLRPFWRLLGETLADEAQRRWPLRKRSGRLRRSLTWAGSRLGRGGIFETAPDRLRFGTAVFYGRFSQFGTKRQQARPIVHIDEAQHAALLRTWLQARATAAGLEVSR